MESSLPEPISRRHFTPVSNSFTLISNSLQRGTSNEISGKSFPHFLFANCCCVSFLCLRSVAINSPILILKNKTLPQIADELEEDVIEIEPIYKLIKDNPDKTKEEIYKMLDL